MSKEWSTPLGVVKGGLLVQPDSTTGLKVMQNQQEPFSERIMEQMEVEERAADLSLRKDKNKSKLENRDSSLYPVSYGNEETIDLSTKWRAPTEGDARPSSSVDNANEPPGQNEKSGDQRNWDRPSSHLLRFHHSRAARFIESYSMSSCSSPDIIVLSDEENTQVNGHVNGFETDSRAESSDSEMLELPPLPCQKQFSKEELKEKQDKLRKLREDLRSEEMKLVLLKKLHQSQVMKDNLLGSAAANVAGKFMPNLNLSRSGGAPTTAPPPLVRGGQLNNAPSKTLIQPPPQSSLIVSPLVRGHGPPPPLVVGQRGNSTSLSSGMLQSMMRPTLGPSLRTPVTTPPNMVMGFPLQNLQATQSGPPGQSQHQIPLNQVPPPTCPSPQSSGQIVQTDRMDNQTPAQKQAAAKLALRKQLEKTLLQIPPPKPPPPEMHFIPNANNQEFVCLLGLEKVVDFITDDPSINQPPPEPFECVQCGTDFSPVWKWQDAGSSRDKKPSVICETCVTTNIKKALKAEHTNRLKTAFVKALQQEQEIEQRMAQAVPSPPPVSPTPPVHTCPTSTPAAAISGQSAPTPPASHSPVHGSMSRIGNSAASAAAAAVVNSAALLQQLPKLSAAHQSLLQAQAQQLHQLAQSLPQPQPAHMLPFAPLLAAQAYSYQLLGKPPPVTSSDLQRQYLLDMIPPRSLPQGSMNWKT